MEYVRDDPDQDLEFYGKSESRHMSLT